MQKAFSLVELSIVLVILGLLTGGILAGQSLIRAAELRSVSTDMARYQTALMSFRDKYMALPGDMPNATAFWGVAGGTGSDITCYSTASTSVATCNGNGNGRINIAGSAGMGEINRLWQHLANAGLIEGGFTGADVTPPVLGTHLPRSKINNAGFAVAWTDNGGDWGETFSSQSNGNQLFFGSEAGGITRGVAIRPEEAWNIDTKIDDGKPDTGKLQTEINYSASCFTGAFPNATYALTTASVQCSFRLQLK